MSLLSMIAVSTTLGAYGIAVKDQESKYKPTFNSSLSRATIQLSYVLNAFIIGCIFPLLRSLAVKSLLSQRGKILSFGDFIQVLSILFLSVLLASVLIYFFRYLCRPKMLSQHSAQLLVHYLDFYVVFMYLLGSTKLCTTYNHVLSN